MDLYTVIGNPVAHSRSPAMHQHFAALTGQNISYDRTLAPVGQFTDVFQRRVAEGLLGANVTVPFKEVAWQRAEQLTARAEQAGAVNTLARQADGSWLGDNTDGAGLVADLQRLGMPLRGQRLLIVGAGGATRGILGALLAQQPASVTLANRTRAKADMLAADFAIEAVAMAALAGRQFDVLINATAASLQDLLLPLPVSLCAGAKLAYDLVYRQGGTVFEHWALAHGCAQSADGLGMLVAQGAESFALWRGVRPDWQQVLTAMREVE